MERRAASLVVSGFLPSASLVEALIHISNEVASMDRKHPLKKASSGAATIIRWIKLLSSLFEELREKNTPICPSSILCFTELFSTIQRAKLLIQDCNLRSAFWNLLQAEVFSQRFHALGKEMGRALDILPVGFLALTDDVREQVGLIHQQVGRANVNVHPQDHRRREELLQLMMTHQSKRSNGGDVAVESKKVKEIMWGLGLRSRLDYEEEIRRLEAEIQRQAGTGGLIAVSNINNFLSLLSRSKSMIFPEDGNHDEMGKEDRLAMAHCKKEDRDSSSRPISVPTVPIEFQCPISMELMRDPVIVASGHTYDRSSIAQWIDSGHHKCPKSGQKLIHMALIPNYALKSLMYQWCKENNVPLADPSSPSSSSDLGSGCDGKLPSVLAVDHISVTKSAVDAVKMIADFLVGKLATGSSEIQRHASYELRLLAKSGMDNRRLIADAGAIPFLVTLLSSHDPRTQENAVTALLNLSIYHNNKLLIIEAGAIDGIVEVLETGKCMEARENAAAAIFSLSMIDEFKLTIGVRPRVIPALVSLLKEGTTVGKKDAATALFNLAIYDANKANAVAAGVVSLLIGLLMDDKAGITDDALAVLCLLVDCDAGLKEMRENNKFVAILVDLMRFGSPKGKESAVGLLLRMCRIEGEETIRCLLLNQCSIASLDRLVSEGSAKAGRKANALLRLLRRFCSQSQEQLQLLQLQKQH